MTDIYMWIKLIALAGFVLTTWFNLLDAMTHEPYSKTCLSVNIVSAIIFAYLSGWL